MSQSQITPVPPTQRIRVLFSSVDGIGHIFPLLPLARELRRAGHPVAFMAPPPARAMLAAEGFRVLPAGPGIKDVVAATAARHPELSYSSFRRSGRSRGQLRSLPTFASS